jgi:hypothetical protein
MHLHPYRGALSDSRDRSGAGIILRGSRSQEVDAVPRRQDGDAG